MIYATQTFDDIALSEISQLEKANTNTYMSHLVKIGTGGKRTRELLFNGYRTSVLQDEKNRGNDGDVSPIMLWIF